MSHFEIKHLRLISTLAETQNMTRAAEKLFITQSALSQQLKLIESRLMTDLFFRTKKKMLLTATGRKVLQTARHVLGLLDDTELEIAKIVNGDTGELKVGTQCIFCYKWLPEVMKGFQKKFPNIRFEIGNSEEVTKELESEKFDFIITVLPLDDEQLAAVPLFKDQMVCIMANDHPLTSSTYVNYADLSKENIIFNSERIKNRFLKNRIHSDAPEPEKSMIVGQAHAIMEMVAAGFGIGFFPKWAAMDAIEEKKIQARPIARTGVDLTWVAAHLKDRDFTLAQKEFIRSAGQLNIGANKPL